MAEENTTLILAQISELKIQVGIMTEKMNQILDHEQRIRALEKWKYSLPLSALMSIGSVAIAIVSFLHH